MNDNFGSIIKQYREAKGLSVRQLATQCNINHTDVSKLENNKIKKPSINMLVAISNILGINVLALYLEGDKKYLSYQPIINKCSCLSGSQISKVLHYIDTLQGETQDDI